MKLPFSLILSILLFSFFLFSRSQDPNNIGSLAVLEEEDVTTIILGSGVDGVTIHLAVNPEDTEVTTSQLSPRPATEWTYEVETETGSLYVFVVSENRLRVIGPNNFNVDVTHAYAEFAEVTDDKAIVAVEEFVDGTVAQVYEALAIEQID